MNLGEMSNFELIGLSVTVFFAAVSLTALIYYGIKLYRLTKGYRETIREQAEDKKSKLDYSYDWIDWEKARR